MSPPTWSPRITAIGLTLTVCALAGCQDNGTTAGASVTAASVVDAESAAPVTTATPSTISTMSSPPTSGTAASNTTTATTTTATTTTSSSTTSTTSTTTTTPTTTTPTTTTSPTTTTTVEIRARSGSTRDVRPPSDIPPPPLPEGWNSSIIGFSAQGREIMATTRSVVDARRTVLVIGGLHGNEPVTPPTVRGLVVATVPDDVEVWLVPEANPDGVAAGTRWNENGVDLNRNFGWDWRPSDGGPGPFSEPETQALAGLIERLRPDVVVWVHQPLGYVGSIGPTDRAFEEAWASGSGTPVRSGVTQHGGGESWTAFVAGVPSMLVEIDSWAATPEMVAAHRSGFEALVAALG